MLISFRRVVAVSLLAVPFVASGQELAAQCRRVSEAASAAEVERDAGRSLAEAKEHLAGKFPGSDLDAGANATYAWPLLRGYALADYVEKYCKIMVPTGGNVPDFHRMMLQQFYRVSVQCSQQGHIERQSFALCWNKQTQGGASIREAEQK